MNPLPTNQADHDALDGQSETVGPVNKEVDTVTPVYFHDCPALGKNARIIKVTLMNKAATEILGHQYKCPFCSQTAGEFEPNDGTWKVTT